MGRSEDNICITGRQSTHSTLTYLYGDHLGSAAVLADTSGQLVDRVRFYPFGGYRGSDSSLQTDRGFTGHRQNDDLGLVYMNARYYVQGIGRFASADTLVPNPKNPQSYNRYSYVQNSPLNYTDPTGHWLCDEDCESYETVPLQIITFEGEGWTSEEKNTAAQVAMKIAIMLDKMSGDFSSPREAFRAVFGGAVTFTRVTDTCANCLAERTGRNTITVYGNASAEEVEGNYYMFGHELAHEFNSDALGTGGYGAPYADLKNEGIYIGETQIAGNNDSGSYVRTTDGYRSSGTPYRQSREATASEDFADMLPNYLYDSFTNDAAGMARFNWMNSHMPGWIELAVAAHQQ